MHLSFDVHFFMTERSFWYGQFIQKLVSVRTEDQSRAPQNLPCGPTTTTTRRLLLRTFISWNWKANKIIIALDHKPREKWGKGVIAFDHKSWANGHSIEERENGKKIVFVLLFFLVKPLLKFIGFVNRYLWFYYLVMFSPFFFFFKHISCLRHWPFLFYNLLLK